MKGKSVSYHLLRNYGIMILLTTVLTILGFAVLSDSNTMYDEDSPYVVFSAPKIIKEDYTAMDTSGIEHMGGGMQVISSDFQILYSRGKPIFDGSRISPGEFTEYLTQTEMNHEIVSSAYCEEKGFWVLVSLPTAIKMNLHIDLNSGNPQFRQTFEALGRFACGYLGILVLSIFFYSRITARFFSEPLKRLCMSVEVMRKGNYSERTEACGCQEFIELATSFNGMAEEIQSQTELKEQSEENRKKLMMDISHDLKNPLMSVIGFAEMIPQETDGQVIKQYADIIKTNGLRANELVHDLFELSQMENPKFQLQCERMDFTEYFREEIIRMLPELEKSGLQVTIGIPEVLALCEFDPRRMRRVISNLLFNAISYCGGHGEMQIEMKTADGLIQITFSNTILSDGEEKMNMRQEESNEYYHVGLGLSIVKKIVSLHGGTVWIDEKEDRSFTIQITLPVDSSQAGRT